MTGILNVYCPIRHSLQIQMRLFSFWSLISKFYHRQSKSLGAIRIWSLYYGRLIGPRYTTYEVFLELTVIQERFALL